LGESFEEYFDETFALWGFKITQNTQFEEVLLKNNTKSVSAIPCTVTTRTE
jgi:hypothetical protein